MNAYKMYMPVRRFDNRCTGIDSTGNYVIGAVHTVPSPGNCAYLKERK